MTGGARLRSAYTIAFLSVWIAQTAESMEDDLADRLRAQRVPLEQRPGPPLAAAPVGVVFGGVSTKGSGCSPATVTPLIREDGKTVTIYFERFETEMSEVDFSTYADCYIAYDIKAPPGYTYTVTQFAYDLLGEVREGVAATLSVSYGFEGEGLPAESVKELPANRLEEVIRHLQVRHVITAEDWAPCSVSRKLQARVAISLVNGSPKTFSKLSLIQIDGRTEREGAPAVELKLVWAKCPTDV